MYPNGATKHLVLDMIGNVWEWCLNTYNDPEAPEPLRIDKQDTSIDKMDTMRVLRGGSFSFNPKLLRVSYRYREFADSRHSDFGFRLAQDIEL